MSVELNPKQLEFCRLYITKGDTYASGFKSYAAAYDIEIPIMEGEDNKAEYRSAEYKVAVAAGSRLLHDKRIQDKIKELLLEKLTDEHVDARISDIIQGGKDADSVQAIKVYNDLKQRVTKKLDITTQGRPMVGMSDEELLKMING